MDLDHASHSLHSFYVHDYVYSTFPKEINLLCEWSLVCCIRLIGKKISFFTQSKVRPIKAFSILTSYDFFALSLTINADRLAHLAENRVGGRGLKSRPEQHAGT